MWHGKFVKLQTRNKFTFCVFIKSFLRIAFVLDQAIFWVQPTKIWMSKVNYIYQTKPPKQLIQSCSHKGSSVGIEACYLPEGVAHRQFTAGRLPYRRKDCVPKSVCGNRPVCSPKCCVRGLPLRAFGSSNGRCHLQWPQKCPHDGT